MHDREATPLKAVNQKIHIHGFFSIKNVKFKINTGVLFFLDSVTIRKMTSSLFMII